MRRIDVKTEDFVLSLDDINTADYAEEDIALIVHESIKIVNIYIPPMSKIKGNPNVYILMETTEDYVQKIYLTGGDYLPVTKKIQSTGRLSVLGGAVEQNTTSVQKTACLKPLINGQWFLSFLRFSS